MSTTEILLLLGLILLVANLLATLLKKSSFNSDELKNEIVKINLDVSKIDPLIRTEFSGNRNEIQKNSKDSREELSNSIKNFSAQILTSAKENRTEMTSSLKSFEEKSAAMRKSLMTFNEINLMTYFKNKNKQKQIPKINLTKYEKR
jgi:hypothetical protein